MKPERVSWRVFVEKMKAMLAVRETPRVIAGSFGAAFLCGTAPFFVGVAAIVPLIAVFRLNKVIGIGVMVLLLANPFMIFVVPMQAWFGLFLMREPIPAWLLGFDAAGLWKGIGSSWKLLVAYALGGYCSALLLAGAVFLSLWPLLEWRNRVKMEKEKGAAGG